MNTEKNLIELFLQEVQDLIKTQEFTMPWYDVQERYEVVGEMNDFEKACYTIEMANEARVQEISGQVLKMGNDHLKNPSLPERSQKMEDDIMLLQHRMAIAHGFMAISMRTHVTREGRLSLRKNFLIVAEKK